MGYNVFGDGGLQEAVRQVFVKLKTLLDGKVPTSDYAPVTKTSDMTQAVGRDANGQLWTAQGGASYYELIQKIVAGYSVLTSEPPDWATNWASYYENIGTSIEPVYAQVGGDSAPAWESTKYYSFDGSALITSPIIYGNGTPDFSLSEVALWIYNPENSLQTSSQNYFVVEMYNYTGDLGYRSLYFQTGSGSASESARMCFARYYKERGIYYIDTSSTTLGQGINTRKSRGISYELYNINYGTVNRHTYFISSMYNTNNGKGIKTIRVSARLGMTPGTEIYIYGVRQ